MEKRLYRQKHRIVIFSEVKIGLDAKVTMPDSLLFLWIRPMGIQCSEERQIKQNRTTGLSPSQKRPVVSHWVMPVDSCTPSSALFPILNISAPIGPPSISRERKLM